MANRFCELFLQNTKMQRPVFPTLLHQQTADLVKAYFTGLPQVDTVLAVNSCARGQASPESDLDFAILADPGTTSDVIAQIEHDWRQHLAGQEHYRAYQQLHPFAQVHLDVITGEYEPSVWDDGGGPDYFEVEIGNHLVYSAPMGPAGAHFTALRQRWLPYYEESLQGQRLQMVKEACEYDLDHIPFYAKRGLYFQAFDRLYKAFQEFLQALFIAKRTYPIAYNKWIKEQISEKLNLPELYRALPPVLAIGNIESFETIEKANTLRSLLLEYC